MQAIEDNNEQMDGVLPKEVYGQLVPEEEPELLSKIIRVFKDIPEDISIDLFGEIYFKFIRRTDYCIDELNAKTKKDRK